MDMVKSLLVVFALILCSGTGCFAQCKEIKAEAKVINTTNGARNGKITVEVKNVNKGEYVVSLFAPDRNNKLSLDTNEISNLPKGTYLVVVSEKAGKGNYCPMTINVTIN